MCRVGRLPAAQRKKLEVGEPERFPTTAQAVSYCGLTSAQVSSAGKETRGPISKQRNKHLQTVLIDAAKVAPMFNPSLKQIHEMVYASGNPKRATHAVSCQMVHY